MGFRKILEVDFYWLIINYMLIFEFIVVVRVRLYVLEFYRKGLVFFFKILLIEGRVG